MREWEALQASLKAPRHALEAGIAHAPEETASIQRAVLDALDRPSPPTRDAAFYGAMLALVAPRPTYRHPTRHDEVVALAGAVGGPVFALDVVLASLSFAHLTASHAGLYTQELAWIVPAREHVMPLEPWVALRRVLQRCESREAARARALDIVTTHGRGDDLHWALAWCFPEVPELLTDDDVHAALTDPRAPGQLFELALLRHEPREVRAAKEGWVIEGLPMVADLAALGGVRALAALRSYVRGESYEPDYDFDGSDPTPRTTVSAAVHVARIGGVDALRVLAESAHREKRILPVFLAAAYEDPDAATAALDGLLATPLVKLGRYRDSVLRRPLLRALRAMFANDSVTEAETHALPAPLASPPWAKSPKKAAKKKPAKSTKKTTTTPRAVPHEERLVWADRNPAELFEVELDYEAQTLESLSEDPEDTFFLLYLFRVGDEVAKKLLATIPPTRWYGQIDDLEGLLARFGLDVLPSVLAYVKRQPDRFGALLAVDSPRVATLAAHLFATSKKNADVAREWLEAFPRAAVIGILEALPDARGKDKTSLTSALAFVRESRPEVVAEVLAAAQSEDLVEAEVEAVTSRPVRAPKLPAFVTPTRLVRPRLRDGGALSLDATTTLVGLLALSDRRAPRPELAEIAATCDPDSLDGFAWSLFVQWLAAGGPSKHAFGLDVLGHFGNGATLRVLGERAREWAPGGLPQRAQAAVDVLALAPGTTGLAAIHRLSQVRSRALAKHAQKTLATVATKRGLTKDDLIDRLVPDLGLDADGSATFDFGERAFTLVVGDDLVPMVVDAEGKRLANLPTPRANEEELGREAVAQWKALKKGIKDVLRAQSKRLELALATGRRFSVEHFETSFARHPLLLHLAQRLVWTAHDGSRRVHVFGVTPDEYLDVDDTPITLEPTWTIALLHPAEADVDELRRWGDRLTDHRVIQPFAQLAREVFVPTDDEREAATIARFAGRVVPTGKILGLDRRGWIRDESADGGHVYVWRKSLGQSEAALTFEPGIYLGAPLDTPEQTLGPVELRGAPLGQLSAIDASELLRDLSDLVAS